MRSGGLKIFGLGLMLGGFAASRGRALLGPKPAADRGSHPEPPQTAIVLPARSAEPLGVRTVAVVFGLALLVTLAGYGWTTMQQRAQLRATAVALTRGEPDRAPDLMARYGCGGCHTIPGIPGADGKVGPNLADLRARVYIGGVANNTADNLVGWIVAPQKYSPRSAMPVTGISEAEARDVAAYLYMQ